MVRRAASERSMEAGPDCEVTVGVLAVKRPGRPAAAGDSEVGAAGPTSGRRRRCRRRGESLYYSRPAMSRRRRQRRRCSACHLARCRGHKVPPTQRHGHTCPPLSLSLSVSVCVCSAGPLNVTAAISDVQTIGLFFVAYQNLTGRGC